MTWLCCVTGLCCQSREGWDSATISYPSDLCNFLLFTCSSTTSSLVFLYFYGLLVQLFWFYVKFYIVGVFPSISQRVAVPLETFLEEHFVDLWTHQHRLCLLLKKSLLLNPHFSSPTLDGGGSGSYFRFLNYLN